MTEHLISRVTQIANHLRDEITAGNVSEGDRLPSEGDMARQHAVSRAVIREAIATLRADGLLTARRGVGVFVSRPEPATLPPFASLSASRMSSVIEVLELRLACESEAAALAAARRSPQQLECVLDAHRQVDRCVAAGETTYETDFALHMAIAEAAQNPFFAELLALLRPGFMTRPAVAPDELRNHHLPDEHHAIVSAILDGDADQARLAMRRHLEGSLTRYKLFLSDRLRDKS